MLELIHKLCNLNEVGKWRVAAATFVSSLFMFSSQLDLQLVKLWSWLQNDTTALLPRLFRHDHWEWAVAVWAFFFWIHGFWLADRAVSKADAVGKVHPWKKYRLQDQYEAEKHRRMQVRRLEAGDDDVNTDESPSPVQQHKCGILMGFWLFELPLYCLPLYIFGIIFASHDVLPRLLLGQHTDYIGRDKWCQTLTPIRALARS